ncbi:MAG: DUF6491 family protein [Pseudomonadota bacterium]
MNCLLKAIVFGVLIGLAMSGAYAAPASGKLQSVLKKYERTGETRRCLSRHSFGSIRAIDDRHLLIRVSPRTSYLSKLPHRCFGLRFHEGIAYKPAAGQVCRTDTFYVLDGTSSHGSACGFGPFEKLRRKSRKSK